MSLASCSESRPWICALPPPMPLERLESVKSICGNVLISRSRTIAKCCGCLLQLAADPLVARDLLELVRALARELHRHDRLAAAARARVEVGACPRQLQVLAGHLRDIRRVVPEEVVVGLVGRGAASGLAARTHNGFRLVGIGAAARDDDHAFGHGEDVAVRLSVGLLLRFRFRRVRPRDHVLRLRVDDVPGVRLPVLDLGLNLREELVERRVLDRKALDGDRRTDQGGLEVVELELRRRPDDLGRGLGILDARELDDDLIRALGVDLRLGDAELVDAIAHDVDRAVEVFLRQLAVGRRDRLERDLESALQVEAERRLLVQRRRRDGHQDNGDEGRTEQPENEE